MDASSKSTILNYFKYLNVYQELGWMIISEFEINRLHEINKHNPLSNYKNKKILLNDIINCISFLSQKKCYFCDDCNFCVEFSCSEKILNKENLRKKLLGLVTLLL